MPCYDDDDDVGTKEQELRMVNTLPYCVIGPYSSTLNRELHKRAWFATVEEAERHAAHCLNGKKSGSVVIVKAVGFVSVPLPKVDIVRFDTTTKED